jgi:hypothetical protein
VFPLQSAAECYKKLFNILWLIPVPFLSQNHFLSWETSHSIHRCNWRVFQSRNLPTFKFCRNFFSSPFAIFGNSSRREVFRTPTQYSFQLPYYFITFPRGGWCSVITLKFTSRLQCLENSLYKQILNMWDLRSWRRWQFWWCPVGHCTSTLKMETTLLRNIASTNRSTKFRNCPARFNSQ